MTSFADTLRVLNDMKASRIVEDYAIAGAMALAFWSEPIPTFDLDVLVFLPGETTPIVSLAPLYEWAKQRGYVPKAEHVMIEGVPVQFLPAHNALADEAIEKAATLQYENVPVRVVRPEHLVALYLEPGARTAKRRERAAALMEADSLDRAVLEDLLERYGLVP
jgi:hypothetical protein